MAAKKKAASKKKPKISKEEVNKLSPFYPGEAKTTFKDIKPKQVAKGKPVEMLIDVTWTKAAYPEVQVSGISVDFIREGSTEVFPSRANSTAIESLSMANKRMKLRVVNVFAEAGGYYARVTFGGHWEILDCVYGENQAKIAVTAS